MRIELIHVIFSPQPSDFLFNSTLHFRMFLYLVKYILRVTVTLLYDGYKVYQRYML